MWFRDSLDCYKPHLDSIRCLAAFSVFVFISGSLVDRHSIMIRDALGTGVRSMTSEAAQQCCEIRSIKHWHAVTQTSCDVHKTALIESNQTCPLNVLNIHLFLFMRLHFVIVNYLCETSKIKIYLTTFQEKMLLERSLWKQLSRTLWERFLYHDGFWTCTMVIMWYSLKYHEICIW